MDEYQKLLRAARRMLQAGYSREEVDAEIARYTANLPRRVGSYMDLFNFVNEGMNPVNEAEARSAQYSPVEDFLRSMGQGASFGFADELAGVGAAMVPGGRGYREAVDASRQRMSDLREVAPTATLLGEIAGGVGVPIGGGTSITRGLLARGVPRVAAGMAGAGATGAVAGGLYGAGEAEGGVTERLPEAGLGAGLGLGTGLVLGGASAWAAPHIKRAAGAVGRSLTRGSNRPFMAAASDIAEEEAARASALTGRSKRGQRIAAGLVETSGARPSVRASVEAERAGMRQVQEEMYRPLQEQWGRVDMPEVQEVMNHPDIAPLARRRIPDIDSRPPSFKELQELRQDLMHRIEAAAPTMDARGVKINPGRPAQLERYTAARDLLTDVMEEQIPGYRAANAQWNQVRGTRRAFQQGQTHFGSRYSAEDIEMALERFTTPEERQAFRDGMAQRWVASLNSREGSTPAAAKRIMEAGPEMRGRLRAMFPDEQSWQQFEHLVATEHNAVEFTKTVRRLLRLAWVAGGAAGGGFAASLLFGN